MSIRAAVKSVALAFSLFALAIAPATVAEAAPAPAPAWKLLAATGPTNLPPEQSEIQRIAVEAEGGTFRLFRELGEGVGTPVTALGLLKVEKGSQEATIGSGQFEVGERVVLSGFFPSETTVLSCSPDCVTAGSTVTLSQAAEAPASGTANKIVKLYTRKMSGVPAWLRVGEELLRGTGIAPGTVITAGPVGGVISLSKPTTAEYSAEPVSFAVRESTAPIAYGADAAAVREVLDVLPVGAFQVAGGPGGDAGHPYFVTFGGELANQDVEPFGVETSDLEGEHAFVHVVTTVPGGAGTGEIVIFPANVGGAATAGTVAVTVGPLPAGMLTAAPAEGSGWICPKAPAGVGVSTVTCTTSVSTPAFLPVEAPLRVPVEVRAGAPAHASVPVGIAGAGAGTDSYQVPIVVSTEPAQYGPATFWAGSFDADGSPSRQAGAHPYASAAYFLLNTVRSPGTGQIVPAADPREVIVDLPPGFSGNPLVTPRCPQSQLVKPLSGASPLCNPGMSVGTLVPQVNGLSLGTRFEDVGLYNDVPARGYAAEFSAKIVGPVQHILASVRSDEDFGVRITAPEAPSTEKLFGAFTVLEGAPAAAHGLAFLTNPSDCAESARATPLVTATADSWQDPANFFEREVLPQPVLNGCDKLSLHPSFTFRPTSTQGSSPVGATAHLHLPLAGLTNPAALAEPPLKRSSVQLPEGLFLNASQAAGLEACSEAQVGYKGSGALPNPTRFDEAPVTCPDGSKLGTVEAVSPLLEEPLHGTIYLARQEENPFHTLIGLYLVIESPRFGLTLKLPGKVVPDPRTGQVTASFDYVPQQPVEDLTLHFRGGGPRSEMASPEVCGAYTTKGEWEPWSAPESGPPAITADTFTVSTGCSPSAATRPFHPSIEAGTTDPKAGAYSPAVIKIARGDGEQEIDRLDFTLPLGLTAKLAGVPYCPEAAIRAAEGKSGRAEMASPSCPAASRLGSVDAAAGVGAQPFHTGGSVYLAGPYKGAPLSAVTVIPAVAGPFDLGNVVVRSATRVDLETARITVESDPLPTILKGIPLKVRSIALDLDRPQFFLNPTNCEPMAFSAALHSSNGGTATPSSRFQVGGCKDLRYKPHIKLSLKGATRRTGHPALKAVLTTPKKGTSANTTRIQVGLPYSEFLDQGNLNKVCTQPQLRSATCPASSVYGHVKVWTPLFEKPLKGNVYIGVGYGHKLPDLVTELNGQVRVLLHGRVDTTKQHGLRNTFEYVPDAPFSRVVLELKGGKKYGLLENSENLCHKTQRASAIFNAQNGLHLHLRPRIHTQCGKKQHRRKNAHRGKAGAGDRKETKHRG